MALEKYCTRSENAIEAMSSKLRRATDWLDHECPGYWKKQIKLAEDAVHEAKLNLERCLMFPTAGERPACREERAALKQAQKRLDYCREKRERVQHWRRQLRHEVFEYEARLGQMKRLLEIDLPDARSKLQLISRRLEEYQIERPPVAAEELPAGSNRDAEATED